ncbi:MAG: YkgJ family cysteine cluster protein [Oscillospiraceae bacterium]|jgi:Fe-S-cluster containining protein|nr:YkgJ family cysteine cluster protein [Oscillospiraceae bacterium]
MLEIFNDYWLPILSAIAGSLIAFWGARAAYFKYKSTKLERDSNTMKHSNPDTPNKDISITNKNDNRTTISINIPNPLADKTESPESIKSNSFSRNSILLKDTWTSLFAENETLQSETITITRQSNGTSDGIVKLNEKDLYSFKGTFDNGILTGEYYSTSKHEDERGAINLKMISSDILTGFCSFAKAAITSGDQIRVSPYIWVSGKHADITNGTYDFCTECYTEKKKCCCASPRIDMPVILESEALVIKQAIKAFKRLKGFSTQYDRSNIRIMDRKNDRDGAPCLFFNQTNSKCEIYDNRPIDCRLFPYDIVFDEETHEYWVGYYDELCDRQLPQDMEQKIHILRPYFFIIYPYIHIFTNQQVCSKLKDAHFQRLHKLREFIF